MMAGNLPVVPTRASLSASGRAAAPSTVRNGAERFFGSVHNSGSRPQSFQQQTASLRQSMQQSHVGAVPAGGRVGGGESAGRPSNGAGTNGGGASVAGTMQRPSAGTVSNREINSGNRAAGSSPSSTQNGNRGEIRPFAPPSSARSSSTSGGTEPQRGTAQSAAGANRDGFRPFTPPSSNEASRGETSANSPAARGSSGSYWNRTAPSAMESRGNTSGSYGRGSSSRPQLDMRQPIVRSPSYGASRGGYGGYHAPTYHAPASHAPSYGGSHSAPSHSSGGGHASAPSGGHSSGGSGGGHSSGGHH